MRPWNPHAQTFHGEPITGQVPVRVVVRGPEMTPQQGAMLQAAYASFAAGARLSIVPNPSAQGSMPDGSRYTIDCVNGVCTCVVWPVGEVDDIPRGGIGIALTTLDGGLVSGHIHKDGDRPQPYILTPEVHRGTRKTTGRWRKRKVDGYSGGKAVWADKFGKKSVVGVDGAIYDSDLLNHQSLDRTFGTNNRAYWVGEYSVGTHFYTDGEKILGSFRDRVDTLPFFRKQSDGTTWLMQITPAFVPEAKLQLYGAQHTEGESTATVGDLLHELEIPVGHAMIWQTLSVSPEGTNARIMFREPGGFQFTKVDISITDNAMEILSMVGSGDRELGSIVTSTTGEIVAGNGTVTRVETRTEGAEVIPGGYGYGHRGESTAFVLTSLASGGVTESGSSQTVTTEQTSGPGIIGPGGIDIPDGWDLFRRDEAVTSRLRLAGTTLRYEEGRQVRFPRGYRNIDRTVNEVDRRWKASYLGAPNVVFRSRTVLTQSTSNQEELSSIVLFLAPAIDFHIVAHYGWRSTLVETSDNRFTSPPPTPVDSSTSELVSTGLRRITATYGGVEILNVETLTDAASVSRFQFVASSAVDPLTGAACVNILEIDTLDSIHAPPLRSWILLADDKSAKHLHEVMDIPEGTGIRIKKDYALLSVV